MSGIRYERSGAKLRSATLGNRVDWLISNAHLIIDYLYRTRLVWKYGHVCQECRGHFDHTAACQKSEHHRLRMEEMI